MKKTTLMGLLLACGIAACNDAAQKDTTPAAKDTASAAMPARADNAKADFKDVKFDYNRDLVCNMPVTAGVSDTAHYDHKVYGFCSAECKALFVKKPQSYLAQIK